MADHFDRRDFFKLGATAGAGILLGGAAGSLSGRNISHVSGLPARIEAKPCDPVRIGFIGVGGQGQSHVRNFLNIEGVEIRAVCDIVEDKVARVQKMCTDKGLAKPGGYSRGENDYKRLCARDDLDLVYIATPWKWHVPMCVEAMNNGKHAATEVPAAVTLDGCWELVETSEKTRRHCVMMENCCYGEPEMTVLNMIRKGMLGEPLHAECGYLHDLRELKFLDDGEGPWRMPHSVERNGNIYPTHGLGPVAEYIDINHGDQFDFLVSMSSKSRGLNLFAEDKYGRNHPLARQEYALGDVNTSLIRTVNGVTIIVIHDCDTPRPYSRLNMIQGTRGIFRGYPDRIYIENKSEPHTWQPLSDYLEEHRHPLWKTIGDTARNAGHGGMDYLEDYRLVRALREGVYPDMDVYDAAAWSAVSELSEQSVANRSRPVDFPDFTRGAWKNSPPIFVTDM